MQEHDARLLRGAAIPTAAVGIAAAIAAYALAGGPGLLGAVLGIVLVFAFFSISFFAVAWAGKKNPQLMFPVALATYTGKIVLFALLIGQLKDLAALDSAALAAAAGAGLTAWVGGLLLAARRDRRPVVEPVPSAAAGGIDDESEVPGGRE